MYARSYFDIFCFELTHTIEQIKYHIRFILQKVSHDLVTDIADIEISMKQSER